MDLLAADMDDMYLVLSADYAHFHLRNEYDAQAEPATGSLSESLRTSLGEWNDRYQPIVSMSPKERLRPQDDIAELDRAGLILAEAVRAETGCKVAYYSEGLLRRAL